MSNRILGKLFGISGSKVRQLYLARGQRALPAEQCERAVRAPDAGVSVEIAASPDAREGRGRGANHINDTAAAHLNGAPCENAFWEKVSVSKASIKNAYSGSKSRTSAIVARRICNIVEIGGLFSTSR